VWRKVLFIDDGDGDDDQNVVDDDVADAGCRKSTCILQFYSDISSRQCASSGTP